MGIPDIRIHGKLSHKEALEEIQLLQQRFDSLNARYEEASYLNDKLIEIIGKDIEEKYNKIYMDYIKEHDPESLM